MTAPVTCAPPAKKPTTEERDNCSVSLEAETAFVSPAVVVALGGFGWDAALRHVSQQNTFTGA